MTNHEIARVLYEIADYLEVAGAAHEGEPRRWRVAAYREAAKFVEHYKEQLGDTFKRGGEKALEALPGIGASMAKKVGELVRTGKLKYLTTLRKELPVDMGELNAIPGLGPKKIAKLYREYHVRTVEDYEKLQHTKVARQRGGRWPRKHVEPIARGIVDQLKQVSAVEAIEVAGSLRRKSETIGDIDIVAAATKPSAVMEAFVSLPDVEHVYSRGNTKTLVRLRTGIDADLRVVEPKSYGAALQYFTGPKEHNIALRKLAGKRGLKLNEYGLFRGTTVVASKTEKHIYRALGVRYQKPEERTGELAVL